MTARDDLAADIEAHVDTALDPHRRAWGYVPAREDWAHTITRQLPDHLLAAGWSRPRVVTTAAELDALPAGTALKQIGDPNDRDDGVLVEAWDDTTLGHRRRRWSIAGGGQRSTADIAHGGAWLVVWSPPVESGETQGGAGATAAAERVVLYPGQCCEGYCVEEADGREVAHDVTKFDADAIADQTQGGAS